MNISTNDLLLHNCQDTPTVRRDGRPAELAALMDLCPRHMMHRCLCHDNSIVKFPFDMTSVFFTCRPKKVSCTVVGG